MLVWCHHWPMTYAYSDMNIWSVVLHKIILTDSEYTMFSGFISLSLVEDLEGDVTWGGEKLCTYAPSKHIQKICDLFWLTGLTTYFKALKYNSFKYSLCWNLPMIEATSIKFYIVYTNSLPSIASTYITKCKQQVFHHLIVYFVLT